MSTECARILDNKLYLWDSHNLWHVYEVGEETPGTQGTMKFVEKKRMRYFPGDISNKLSLQGDKIEIFTYKNPKTTDNYVKENDERKTSTRLIIKSTDGGLDYTGDLPLDNPDDYNLSSVRVS